MGLSTPLTCYRKMVRKLNAKAHDLEEITHSSDNCSPGMGSTGAIPVEFFKQARDIRTGADLLKSCIQTGENSKGLPTASVLPPLLCCDELSTPLTCYRKMVRKLNAKAHDLEEITHSSDNCSPGMGSTGAIPVELFKQARDIRIG